MAGVDWYVYWVVFCGLAANLWLCVKLGGVAGRVIYAAAAAASFTRFCWACGRVHGFKVQKLPSWVYAPQVWFGFFIAELGATKGSISHMGGAGAWNGIGDWTVFPRKEIEPCA